LVALEIRFEEGEQRWQTFGWAGAVLLLMGGHTIREEGTAQELVPIIAPGVSLQRNSLGIH